MRALLAALACLAVLPASAVATDDGHSDWTQVDHFGLPTNNPQFTLRAGESFQIARKFWNDASPPCASPRIYTAPQPEIAAATETPHAVGTTDWCSIWIPEDLMFEHTWLARIRACTIVVHEYGHTLRIYGRGHAKQHGSVMYPTIAAHEAVYACYRRFLPKGKGREFREEVGRKPLFLHR